MPPFAKSFLHALNRMQERETLRPDQLGERARALLRDRFGVDQGEAAVAFAHGPLGLISDHTHYFDGFALLMPLSQGVAVAARATSSVTSRVVLERSGQVYAFDRSVPAHHPDPAADPEACLVARLARQKVPEGQVEIAVVSTVPDVCPDVYLAALGVAVQRGVQVLAPTSEGSTSEGRAADLKAIRGAAAGCTGYPASLAYAIAARDGQPALTARGPDMLALVDAATLEHLPVELTPRERLGWGLVGLGTAPPLTPDVCRENAARAEEALALLQARGFGGLRSFRELEHRDLQRALGVLPLRLRPIARYLVTENRRVQKLIATVRRRDWQMLGALLFMVHASRRSDEGATSPEADFVVEQVEAMSTEGMYGACLTGRGACVLVAGQPFVVPQCLDRIRTAFQERFGAAPTVMLL